MKISWKKIGRGFVLGSCAIALLILGFFVGAHQQTTSKQSSRLPLGIYQNDHGDTFQIVGYARDRITQQEMMIYQELSNDFGLWVVPAATINNKSSHLSMISSGFMAPPAAIPQLTKPKNTLTDEVWLAHQS